MCFVTLKTLRAQSNECTFRTLEVTGNMAGFQESERC